MPLRFNHMELTLAPGELSASRSDIKAFFRDVFDFDSLDVPILGQTGLLLRTDPETSQFLLITEQKEHMQSPGYDHLGFLLETRADVDACFARCQDWQKRDDRVRIKEYEDLVIEGTTVRAFYVRFLLPIWFDVQVIENSAGSDGVRDWRFA